MLLEASRNAAGPVAGRRLWFRRRGQSRRGQATKGVWGMPWRQEAMKGVEDCDKLGGLVKRELIPRSLNERCVNP